MRAIFADARGGVFIPIADCLREGEALALRRGRHESYRDETRTVASE